jgi:hypothetical protein
MVKGLKITTIRGFENYALCEGGRVYSFHQQIHELGLTGEISQRIDRAGYKTVRLSKNGKTYTRWLHRLLAENYLSNPLNLQEVNHKDGNKLNNDLANLEWTTHQQNVQHAFYNNLIKRKTKWVINLLSGKIYQSARQAATQNGFPYSSLKNLLNGNRTNTTQLRYIEK